MNILSKYGREVRRWRVVILGSGWGSYSLLRAIDKKDIDVICISPRNHFLFTPLLASTTVGRILLLVYHTAVSGTLEFRSIVEPIRNTGFRDEHHFHLSYATKLDHQTKTVYCTSALDPSISYPVKYDTLTIGVGAVPNTFGISGVHEHALLLKEIHDAQLIRRKILTNFELATQPSISKEEMNRLLHFVIVGGGPTGVEFGAEFYDFLQQDLKRLYPNEGHAVQITLIEANEILSAFDTKLRSYTERLIAKRKGMKIIKASVNSMRYNINNMMLLRAS
jgi:NADH:ubiquinone reductase (non-electrogenic)